MKILEEFTVDRLPKLETDRLVLRQFTLEDADDIFSYSRMEEVSFNAGFPQSKSVENTYEYPIIFILILTKIRRFQLVMGLYLKMVIK